MEAEFEDDDTYGGDQLIPGAAWSNLGNPGAKDDASIVYINLMRFLECEVIYLSILSSRHNLTLCAASNNWLTE